MRPDCHGAIHTAKSLGQARDFESYGAIAPHHTHEGSGCHVLRGLRLLYQWVLAGFSGVAPNPAADASGDLRQSAADTD
jgi:hypothetical protein